MHNMEDAFPSCNREENFKVSLWDLYDPLKDQGWIESHDIWHCQFVCLFVCLFACLSQILYLKIMKQNQ